MRGGGGQKEQSHRPRSGSLALWTQVSVTSKPGENLLAYPGCCLEWKEPRVLALAPAPLVLAPDVFCTALS